MIKFLDLQAITAKYQDEISEAVGRVVQSGWYLQGKANADFEADYARFIGSDYCVGCANGLDALILIFRAYLELGYLQPGDEVLVPANTFIASVLAITENNLKPVLVEPDPETLQIDETRMEAAITPRTKALCLVHLYGRNAYTQAIAALCEQHHLLLVEDNAQAHGCRCGELRTGALGHASGHSFYPGKNLGALGDGGAVTTNDKALADTIRALANYGSQAKYVFKYAGRNSRLDEIQAAALQVKLRHLEEDNAHRQAIAAYYYEHLNHPCLRLPRRLPDAENVYHLFPIFLQTKAQRDSLQAYLTAQGVQTLIHYPIPPHLQECYAKAPWNDYAAVAATAHSAAQPSQLSITEHLADTELSLPISPVMSIQDAQIIVELINHWH
ncbi:MAG: DegT/DnrJ/EryC1/StrS family aminotransferase [Bacteroidales bacterium]|nr:DegT/DnrJ/EryC1/StrS family aminotransferase [Bacteroidales bacterium]